MKTIVYYDIMAWESAEVDDLDELKDRCGKIVQMLKGLGIVKFELKTTGIEQQAEQGEPNEQPATN